MNEKKIRDRFFLQNAKLVNKIHSKLNKGKRTIKQNNAKISFVKEGLYQITFIATERTASFETSFGCEMFKGLIGNVYKFDYLNVSETKKWHINDWNRYIRYTAKYIISLVEYAESTRYNEKDYKNDKYDYQGIITEYSQHFKERTIKGIEWDKYMESEGIKGDYFINAFIAYGAYYTDYIQVIKQTVFTKKLTKLICGARNGKISAKTKRYFSEERKDKNTL